MRNRKAASAAALVAVVMALAACSPTGSEAPNKVGSGNGPTGGAGSASGRTDTQATAPASETKTQ